jgi:hypothetical protein
MFGVGDNMTGTMFKRLLRGYNVLQRRFKETLTIKHLTGESEDAHGQTTRSYASTITQGIVYDTFDEYLQTQFSDLKSGEYVFLLPIGTTIADRDMITTSNGIEYMIRKTDFLSPQGEIIGVVAYGQRGGPKT